VTDSVSRIYIRQESRKTTKMPARQVREYWEQEAPTRPEIIANARKREQVGKLMLIIVIALILGIGLGTRCARVLALGDLAVLDPSMPTARRTNIDRRMQR